MTLTGNPLVEFYGALKNARWPGKCVLCAVTVVVLSLSVACTWHYIGGLWPDDSPVPVLIVVGFLAVVLGGYAAGVYLFRRWTKKSLTRALVLAVIATLGIGASFLFLLDSYIDPALPSLATGPTERDKRIFTERVLQSRYQHPEYDLRRIKASFGNDINLVHTHEYRHEVRWVLAPLWLAGLVGLSTSSTSLLLLYRQHQERQRRRRARATGTIDTSANGPVVGTDDGRDAAGTVPDAGANGLVTIQFVAGDRGGGPRVQLQLPGEEKAIREAVGLGRYRDAFAFAPSVFAASIDDVIGCQRHRPAIVHFVGHGDERRLVFVRDRDLLPEWVALDPGQVETLFSHFPARVRLVVFNTCRSLELARHLTGKAIVDMAIGVEGLIRDDHARQFAATLYRQFADGRSVRDAFALAELQLGEADATTRPVLLHADSVDPGSVQFAPRHNEEP